MYAAATSLHLPSWSGSSGGETWHGPGQSDIGVISYASDENLEQLVKPSAVTIRTQIHTIDNRNKISELALVAAQRFAATSGHVLNDDIPNGICIVLRPRTNVDMHEASAPGQILIQDITNGICIALRPRAECRYALYFTIVPYIS